MSRREKWRIRCEIEVAFRSEKEGFTVYNALKPDITGVPLKRARLTMVIKKEKLKVAIDAQDLTALRALANSTLKYVALAKKVIETV